MRSRLQVSWFKILRNIIKSFKIALFPNQYQKLMSTNSNEADDLMQQSHTKETKLEKFLRVVIDEQTMDCINTYLQHNQNPSNQANNKSDKIKLYQDLLIIQRFKAMEKKIINRKKIDEICQQLKTETNFSVATIRERIQKKLSNVSKQEIINHIQNGVNFAFDSKRKLVSSKNIKNNMSQEDNLGLDDRTGNEARSKQSKKSKVIYVTSSMEESGSSVEEIPKTKQKGKKTSTIEEKSNEKESQIRQFDNPQCYNQFRMDSEHESDEQILISKEQENKYKISTVNSETILIELMQKMKQFYLKQKSKPKEDHPSTHLPQKQIKHPEVIKQERAQPIRTENSEVKNNLINLQFSDESHQIQCENREDEMGPTPEELYWYCSVDDWKLATQSQQYSYLKWYQDEDDFLAKIVKTMGAEQAISSLQVLKKYKESKNIIARLNKLGLTIPNHVMVNLLASQNQ